MARAAPHRSAHTLGISSTFTLLDGLEPESRLAFLEAALDEAHEGVQIAAVKALSDPARANRKDLVVDRFADLLSAARAEVARDPTDFLAIARSKIVDGRDPARHGAYRLVGDLGGFEGIELLMLGIGDTSMRVRDGVLQALERWLREFVGRCAAAEEVGDLHALTPGHRDVARRAFEAVLSQYSAHKQSVFVELLVQVGEVAMPVVTGTVLVRRDAEVATALAKALGEQTSRGGVALLLRMAIDKSAAAQAVAATVLRTRRDATFAHAVAARVVAATDAPMRLAIEMAREIPWPAIVMPVAAQLDAAVALGILQALATCRIDDKRRQQHVETFLGHGDAEVRLQALATLRTMGCQGGFEAIERTLADADPVVQLRAAELVVEMAPGNKLAMLTPLLNAASESVRKLAIREISKESFARYMRRYDQMDPRARQVAARALAKIDASMLDRLAGEVASLDSSRRLKALSIVEFIDAGAAMREPLLELLSDPDPTVRATTIGIVELTGNMEGMKLLIGLLTDRDRRVRANAVEAFEQLEDRRYVQLLTPFLRDPDNRVRANAAKALWNLGWEEARDELVEMLADPDDDMRVSAAWAIGEVAFAGARELLETRESIELSGMVRSKIRAAIAAMGVEAGGEA